MARWSQANRSAGACQRPGAADHTRCGFARSSLACPGRAGVRPIPDRAAAHIGTGAPAGGGVAGGVLRLGAATQRIAGAFAARGTHRVCRGGTDSRARAGRDGGYASLAVGVTGQESHGAHLLDGLIDEGDDGPNGHLGRRAICAQCGVGETAALLIADRDAHAGAEDETRAVHVGRARNCLVGGLCPTTASSVQGRVQRLSSQR